MILEEESFHGANEKNQEGVNAFLRAASMGRMDICRLLYSHKHFDREGINEVNRTKLAFLLRFALNATATAALSFASPAATGNNI